nr:tetratricopeptide repeat protein [Gammaproteobacteria bacterium]NIR94998.1 tetratricopeptide repeat protein [Gammaproteobacteria bacterium]
VIEEASRELTEDAIVFEHLGDILFDLRNIERARDAYERALQLEPENVELRKKLESLVD